MSDDVKRLQQKIEELAARVVRAEARADEAVRKSSESLHELQSMATGLMSHMGQVEANRMQASQAHAARFARLETMIGGLSRENDDDKRRAAMLRAYQLSIPVLTALVGVVAALASK